MSSIFRQIYEARGGCLQEKAPPGFEAWTHRLITRKKMPVEKAYALAWSKKNKGEKPPRVAHPAEKGEKVGGKIKEPPKRKVEAVLAARRKSSKAKSKPKAKAKKSPSKRAR